MTPAEFVATVLDPGLAWCAKLPGWKIPSDDRARVLLTAISGQEANWTARIQGGIGPARGLFQFERGGGVAGVLNDDATGLLAEQACRVSNVPINSIAVWQALALPAHDNLAVAFARLLLWSDVAPLPQVGDEKGAYAYYLRLWRPGAPDSARWIVRYPQAMAAIAPGAVA